MEEKRLKNIARAMRMHGVAPRIHSNTRRVPSHTISLQSVEYVVRFDINYAEQHARVCSYQDVYLGTNRMMCARVVYTPSNFDKG